MTPSHEFGFELQVCQWAERHWPPGAERTRPIIVARQLGIKRRRWDTIVLECDPAGLAARARFGRKALDSDLLDVVRHAPADWAYYRDALPDPGYPWRYVRESIHRADDRDVLDVRKDGRRIEIRRRYPYPDWLERVVAIENKPDLDASAARDLAPQLERDVALSLADAVWVATAASGERVEPALLEQIPVEAGILTLDGGEAEVAWHPRRVDVDRPGTRILDNPDGRGFDASAGRFEYVDAEWKRAKRLAIAERAYERGWRAFVDSMRPDCRHYILEPTADGTLPYCRAKECHQTAAECREACGAIEPEPPVWRSRGWPIEGGPGKGLQRLLDRQRQRWRPDAD